MRKNKTNIKIKTGLNLKGVKVYVLGGVCAFMAVTSIFMTIESTTNGAEIADLQKKEADLLTQQQQLQQTLVETLSVNTLQEQSSVLGFVKVSNLVYVANSENVADSEPVAKLP